LGEAASPSGEEAADRLAAELGVLPVLGRALWARGLRTPADAERFLRPALADLFDPFLMKGASAAVDRLQRALREREPICIYGDYDVDGVTSTALLVSTLRRFAACAPGAQPPARIDFYVPHRLKEGYGLNLDAVAKLRARGVRLLVTADCGVTAVAEIDRAAELGLDVLVIDHHTASQSAEGLPRAVAILNPHQPGCAFPGKELAAVGVAFHVLLALRKRLREDGWFQRSKEPNLREALDLVALGTVADVVPLVATNRVLVHFGLQELSRGARAGVAALKRVANLPGEVTAGDVGFKLGPRLNAAGRLDDASVGVRLLLTEDPAEAQRLAGQLDRANAERQELQARIAEQAIEQAGKLGPPEERRSLLVWSSGWHPGVVGIVASRLVERFHRPALVLAESDGVAKGSGRSVEGFHLYDALAACAEHVTRFGGHKHAAGVTLPASALPRFAEAFEARARAGLTPEQLTPKVRIDARLLAHEASLPLAQQLRRLSPFGAGNPEPVFVCDGLPVREVRVLPDKRGAGPGHLKLRVGHEAEPLDAIAFGMGDRAPAPGASVAAAVQLSVDSYFGEERVQLKVKALR
jgi:single-stranded-DNA-specific exonuclease